MSLQVSIVLILGAPKSLGWALFWYAYPTQNQKTNDDNNNDENSITVLLFMTTGNVMQQLL